jgi:2-haloacid dehalogenase
MDFFLTEVCSYDWNLKQDAGRSWREGCEELIRQYPNYKDEINAYDHRWEETLGEAIVQNVALLNELKSKGQHRLLALTNWSQEKFPVARSRFEFLNHFEGIVVSGEEKCRKPGKEIYGILFDRYNIKPSKAVFIDDSPDNVETSNQLGMRAHCFRNINELNSFLIQCGVL